MENGLISGPCDLARTSLNILRRFVALNIQAEVSAK